MSPVTTTAVMLTGPPGAGKSSVLEELVTLLEIDGIEFGALESEQLAWGSPWLSGRDWLRQLTAVMEIQRQAGRRLFLIAATTETSSELAEALRAIAADEAVTVLLTASPDVVAERIEAREPDRWPGRRRLIEHARRLASSMPDLIGIDVRVDTEDRDAADVAREVRSQLRARGLTL